MGPGVRIGRGEALAVVGFLAITAALVIVVMAISGNTARRELPAEPPITMQSRYPENPVRSGPHELAGGNYRIDWSTRDVTPQGECGTAVMFIPDGQGQRADVALGQMPAGRSRTDSTTARGIRAGRYTIAVMSGCGEWSLSISRQ